MKPHARRQTALWLIVIGFCLAVTSGYFLVGLLQDKNSLMPATGPQIPMTAPYPLPGTPTLLSTPTSTASNLPPAKQTIEAQAEQQRRNGLTPPPPGVTKPAPPTQNPNQTPIMAASTPAGDGKIIDSGLAPLPASIYTIQNQWYTQLNDRIITVYAGAVRGNGATELPRPWQGIVRVLVSSLDDKTTFPAEGGEYPSSVKDGALRIVGAQGKRLILLSESGATLYFDIPARSFVTSLSEIVPTVTPRQP